jgi:hypothetical protein
MKNSSKKLDTRRIIIEAAERLFGQVGFQKTTLADIAHELHMSTDPRRRELGEGLGSSCEQSAR